VAFELVRDQGCFVVGAGLDGEVLFAADAAVGELLIALAAGAGREHREGTAVGTADGELLYAVAESGYGGFLLLLILD
jgi:hypothetical protein